ncbi:hypothetical protein HBI24_202210 [Parastagonospora nodorum]|nr:hypothetical protein HBI24_202210 [Parastagonospora nodorum]
MTPTILIVGATGNTGVNTVHTLSTLLNSPSHPLSNHRILALARSTKTPTSTALSNLPSVEVVEKDWTTITTSWLTSQHVTRAFVASHNLPSHFSDESSLLVALLHASVQYVVRISTTPEVVSAASKVYYARAHWALETMLADADFKNMAWTSLQPNVFVGPYLGGPAAWVREYKNTGVQGKLGIILGEDDSVAILDAGDVGAIAGNLLALRDVEEHNGKRYVIRGPENVSGKDVLEWVEEAAGTKVEEVVWRDTSMIKGLGEKGYPENVIESIMCTCEPAWAGLCRTDVVPTSEEVVRLRAPRGSAEEGFLALVKGEE